MIAIAQSGPVYGMLGLVLGGLITAAAAVWNGRRQDKTEQRNTSGTVATADSAVVFANQLAVFDASEKLRHDMRDQIEACQAEIATLKNERDALERRLREQAIENAKALEAYRARIQTLEDDLMKMSDRLREDEAGAQQRKDT